LTGVFLSPKHLAMNQSMLKLSPSNAATAAVIAVIILFRRLSCVWDLRFRR
jgi:hypothetical protein